MMQGALHGVTRKGIRETNGASLGLAVFQRINASELKASHSENKILGKVWKLGVRRVSLSTREGVRLGLM